MSSADAIAAPSRERASAALWAAVAVVLGTVGVAYWPTFVSLVSVWRQSDTFAHCFLSAPVSLYLIYRKRLSIRSSFIHRVPYGRGEIARHRNCA